MQVSQDSDETILHLIAAQRDPKALETLYDRHSQTVYNVIHRIVHDPAIADDVLQETFSKVWQKAGEFSGQGSVAGWIFRIARNKSLDQLRRQKARPQPVASGFAGDKQALWGGLATAGTEVEQVIELHMSNHHLREALAQIPAEQRHCLEMAYFDGMTQKQIAEYTQTPLGTVKTRLRTGLERLERIFRAAGYRDEDIK